MKFKSSGEVRSFLKENGVTCEFKVRDTRNPFGGAGLYIVTIPTTETIASRSTPRGTQFFSNTPEGMKIVALMNTIQSLLVGSNASIC